VAVALAAGSIFTMGGVVFGIASLYPVLYYESALEASSCGTPALDDAGEACDARAETECCVKQEMYFTSVTSIALFGADGAMLVYGELGDRLGPRWCFGVGASLAWFGLSLLGLGAATGSDFLWLSALLCVGVSGPGVFMGCLFLGERYPHLHAVISAVGAAMWDASALVFKLFATAYFATVPAEPPGAPPSLGLPTIVMGWLCMTVTLGAFTFKVLPSKALLEQLRTSEPSSQPLTQSEEAPNKTAKAAAPMEHAPPADGSEAAPTFLSVFLRTDTLLMLGFMAVFNLKSSFYIATFATQMRGLFYEPTAISLSETFNIAFPVGGFCTSFVGAILLDRLGQREDLYLTLVVLLAIMFGLYNLLPYAASQFASALLFGPTRTLQWACYFHFLSLPKRYPARYTARLLGYGNLVIAVIGDGPLAGLDAFVMSADVDDRPQRYQTVHFVLQLALVCCLALPWYLHGQHISSKGSGGALPRVSESLDTVPCADELPGNYEEPSAEEEEEDEEEEAAPPAKSERAVGGDVEMAPLPIPANGAADHAATKAADAIADAPPVRAPAAEAPPRLPPPARVPLSPSAHDMDMD